MNGVQALKFRCLFKTFDANNDNVLNETDFHKLFERLNETTHNPQAAYQASRRWWRVMARFADKNGDGKITATEFAAWAMAVSQEIATTGEGSLSFQRLGNALFDSMEGVELEQGNGKVSLSEYKNWFAAFQIKGDAAEIFAKLDTNNDGEISREEFVILLKEFFLAENMEAAGNYLWGNPFPAS